MNFSKVHSSSLLQCCMNSLGPVYFNLCLFQECVPFLRFTDYGSYYELLRMMTIISVIWFSACSAKKGGGD